MSIPDFAASIVFLIRVWLPGGAAIIFSQSCNFELNFFVDNPYVKKLALEAFESISCPKISSKQQYLKFENFLTMFEKAENDLKN